MNSFSTPIRIQLHCSCSFSRTKTLVKPALERFDKYFRGWPNEPSELAKMIPFLFQSLTFAKNHHILCPFQILIYSRNHYLIYFSPSSIKAFVFSFDCRENLCVKVSPVFLYIDIYMVFHISSILKELALASEERLN